MAKITNPQHPMNYNEITAARLRLFFFVDDDDDDVRGRGFFCLPLCTKTRVIRRGALFLRLSLSRGRSRPLFRYLS